MAKLGRDSKPLPDQLSDAEIIAGTATSDHVISAADLKLGAETHAPVRVGGKNTVINAGGVDVDPPTYSSDAAAETALGAGFLYFDAQGNVRKSGDGDAPSPRPYLGYNGLVFNGAGFQKNNDNFSIASAETEYAVERGVTRTFKYPSGGSLKTDDFIPVYSNRSYTMSGDVMRRNTVTPLVAGSGMYTLIGLTYYDSAGDEISSRYTYEYASATFAVSPQAGDTVLHVSDVSTFTSTAGGRDYLRVNKNSYSANGIIVPGYSQDILYFGKSQIDFANNQIPLTSALTADSPFVGQPIGAPLDQMTQSGPKNVLVDFSLREADGVWTSLSKTLSGTDLPNQWLTSKMAIGAASAKIFVYPYTANGANGDECWFANLKIVED